MTTGRFIIEYVANEWGDYNRLLDTAQDPPEEVFTDQMEPEDATLCRDLSNLVDLLNEMAAELALVKMGL